MRPRRPNLGALAYIRNVWKRAGVVLAGRSHRAAELDARLAEYAATP